MSGNRGWTIQVLVDPRPNFWRLFLGGTRSYHTFLALVDPGRQPVAELHFSAKNRDGITFKKGNHLGRADFRLTSTFNVLSEAVGAEKGGSAYRAALGKVCPHNDAPRLKANLMVHNAGLSLRHLADMEGTEMRHHVSMEGCENEMARLFQICCAVADVINRLNFIFTGYGLGFPATNCRAGSKAVVKHALKAEFPSIGAGGRFDVSDKGPLHCGKNLGFNRNLPIDESLGFFPAIENVTTQEALLYWKARLKKTCRNVADPQNGFCSPQRSWQP